MAKRQVGAAVELIGGVDTPLVVVREIRIGGERMFPELTETIAYQ